jgi:glutathione synthase/RimK-type ligase-like ATP-grasp enzyme
MKVALATAAQVTSDVAHDVPLAVALRRQGVQVALAVWDDPAVDWSGFDLVIVRSTWDYATRIADFRAWIDHVAERTRLWNPAPLMHWNLDKRYLRDLEARGVRLPPTAWLERGADDSLAELLAQRGWREAVVKPVVSASARETWRVTRAEAPAAEARLKANLAREPMMLQSFVDAILQEGELSLIYIDGTFTHAVRKRPAPGDFRVQLEHGGSEEPVTPDARLVAAGARVLRAASPEPIPYARVDLVPQADGEPLLIELELVEPCLYLGLAQEAAERMARSALAAVGAYGL